MDATAWNQRYADKELVWSATPNQFVASELVDLTPGRAVDLAAGEGRNALWLASLGWDVTAVDFAQAGLDKGRAVESAIATDHRVHWVCADVLAFAATPPGQRVLRNADVPGMERIKGWQEAARGMQAA